MTRKAQERRADSRATEPQRRSLSWRAALMGKGLPARRDNASSSAETRIHESAQPLRLPASAQTPFRAKADLAAHGDTEPGPSTPPRQSPIVPRTGPVIFGHHRCEHPVAIRYDVCPAIRDSLSTAVCGGVASWTRSASSGSPSSCLAGAMG